MYFKKFFATASAIAIIVGSLGTMGVLANNCGDTSWTFTYATGGNMYRLSKRLVNSTTGFPCSS